MSSDRYIDGSEYVEVLQRILYVNRLAVDIVLLNDLILNSFEKNGCSGYRQHIDHWQTIFKEFCGAEVGLDFECCDEVDDSNFPYIGFDPVHRFLLYLHRDGFGKYIAVSQNHEKLELDAAPGPFVVVRKSATVLNRSDGLSIISFTKTLFDRYKLQYIESILATIFVNIISLATSLYAMQIYDRVVPSRSYSTLIVLTVGVLVAMVFEFALKMIRANLSRYIISQVDRDLSSEVLSRMLNIRMDQFPKDLGTLTAKVKSYESIRGFLSSTTIYVLADAPFAFFFILIVGFIGSPVISIIICFFLMVSVLVSLYLKKKVDTFAANAHTSSNKKTGFLVEVIDGLESIKSTGNVSRVLSSWRSISDVSNKDEMNVREKTEQITLIAATLQQLSYISVVCFGAYLLSEGFLTMGGMVACSILSSRSLSPISTLPGLLSQWASVRASINGLDDLYKLQKNGSLSTPMVSVKTLKGRFEINDLIFAYSQSRAILTIPKLIIEAGEKVGIVGPVGSGKSTLLKILTGQYYPNHGSVLLDQTDMRRYSELALAQGIAYLQQEQRLFSGTLRDNLLLGVLDPGDPVILAACAKTGLIQLIQSHPDALDLPIYEGGKGLSGGQKQLLAVTRMILRKPTIWLLDEPTTSMDQTLENLIVSLLREVVDPRQTMVLVTHKTNLLQLVDRVIVISQHRVILDGKRDEIFNALSRINT
jgi:ATP-binding cassette, subfamily C, bacterial LapB